MKKNTKDFDTKDSEKITDKILIDVIEIRLHLNALLNSNNNLLSHIFYIEDRLREIKSIIKNINP
jgi:hypothetical protein